jgi:hypothetical protein
MLFYQRYIVSIMVLVIQLLVFVSACFGAGYAGPLDHPPITW